MSTSSCNRGGNPAATPAVAGVTAQQVLCAAVLGLGVLAAAPQARAQAQEPSAEQQSYAMPAGPLAQSLNRFASQAGITLSFEPELVSGKQAPALTGNYSPSEGLRNLLAGSGLVAVPNRGGFILQRGSTDNAVIQLSPLAVTASVLQDFMTPTQGEVGYYRPLAFTATKTNTPVLETPASVATVTQDVLTEQGITSVDEALHNFANFTRTGAAFGAFENYSSRGFFTNNADNYLRNGRAYARFIAPPIESVERVEVLKGPAGFLYGKGSPGGLVNFITKRPTPEFEASVTGTVGAYDYYKAAVDIGGPIDDLWGYRVNASTLESESYRDFAYVDRDFLALAVDWMPTDATTVLFNVDYLKDRRPQITGTVALNGEIVDIPKSRVLNQPWGQYNTDVFNAGFNTETEMSDNWRLYTSYNFQRFEIDRLDSLPSFILDEATGDVRFRARDRESTSDVHSAILDLTGTFLTGGVEHTLLVGANLDYESGSGRDSNTINSVQNVFDPTYTDAPPDFTIPPGWKEKIRTAGLYVQDQMGVTDRLDLILGARFSVYDYEWRDVEAPADVYEEEDKSLTPRLGLVYKLRESTSLYATYAEGFEPNGPAFDGTNTGEQLDPTESTQYEAGVKMELFEQRLGLSLAAFQITRTGEPYYDAVADLTVQRGERRHRGLEFDLSGRLGEQWNLMFSTMYLDTEITQDADPTLIGNESAGAPELSFSLWTSYDLHPQVAGLKVFGGVRYESDRPGDDANSFTLPSYSRVDVGASYTIPTGANELVLRLNIDNLFDERYYYGGGFGVGNANVGIGEHRTWHVSASYRF